MSVKIMVDSTADLSARVTDKVIIVPLTIRLGDKEYVDQYAPSLGLYETQRSSFAKIR